MQASNVMAEDASTIRHARYTLVADPGCVETQVSTPAINRSDVDMCILSIDEHEYIIRFK